MANIGQVFAAATAQDKRVLIPYLTAGDPSLERSVALMQLLAEVGAGIIELGIPFSDPMADGPVIQQAMNRALAAGTRLENIFSIVEQFRVRYSTPVILMGYLNPVYAYGTHAFARDARQAGVDGVLMVDMPPEEADEFCDPFSHYGLTTIFLATPVTNEERIRRLRKYARGFVYFVSVTGVTGERKLIPREIVTNISAIRQAVGLPVALGFGISGPRIIREFSPFVDGFVVGSALIRRWEVTSFDATSPDLSAFVRELVAACEGCK